MLLVGLGAALAALLAVRPGGPLGVAVSGGWPVGVAVVLAVTVAGYLYRRSRPSASGSFGIEDFRDDVHQSLSNHLTPRQVHLFMLAVHILLSVVSVARVLYVAVLGLTHSPRELTATPKSEWGASRRVRGYSISATVYRCDT
jgi:hypothetical protein